LADELAEVVLQQLVKEGNVVSCVFDQKKKIKGIKCKVYEYDMRKFDSQIHHIMNFVKPDAIVFAGRIMDNHLREESNDFEQMYHILKETDEYQVKKMIYLSSLEVNQIDNQENRSSDWAIYHAQLEHMIELASRRNGMQTTILRTAPIFFGEEESNLNGSKELFLTHNVMQPIHIKDVAIAISRMVEEERGNLTLNLCGSKGFVQKSTDINGHISSCEIQYSNDEIKKMISWTDYNEFHPGDRINENLDKKIDSKYKKKNRKNKEKGSKVFLRQLAENLVLFVLFFIPQMLLNDHSLFSRIHWMLIYIVVISLYSGMIQSTIAVLLASISYLFIQEINILEITSIYSYLEYLIVLVEYIFFGIAVAYSTNMIRNRLFDKNMDYDLLRDDYEELKVVYEQNTRIKDEYEQRLINAKDSLPKLQSVMNRLNVLQPDKIFMEVNYVVGEFLRTDTVAVYRVDKDSSYLRLLASLNESSTFGGKTWTLESFPEILKKIDKGEIAMGKAWSEEPAMTIPINHEKECIAIIVIKDLSLETRSLYYLNLMRTLASLVSEAMTRALEYERLIETRRYIDGTHVLIREEFQKQLEIQREMELNKIASYTVLSVPERDWREIYIAADKTLRTVDYLGLNEKDELAIILVNTANNECASAINRLESRGISARIDE
jgi:hypothetical protein